MTIPRKPVEISGEAYQLALDTLGLSQRAAALTLFGVDERTSRRWRTDGPPRAAAIALALMMANGVHPDEIESLLVKTYGKPGRKRPPNRAQK